MKYLDSADGDPISPLPTLGSSSCSPGALTGHGLRFGETSAGHFITTKGTQDTFLGSEMAR